MTLTRGLNVLSPTPSNFISLFVPNDTSVVVLIVLCFGVVFYAVCTLCIFIVLVIISSGN